MSLIEKKVLENYRAGFNCAQSVISAYSEKFDIDNKTVMAISCGFGGGMGKLQGTCGAVTGAYMVLGAHNYKEDIHLQVSKDKSISMVQEFSKRFKEIHGSTDCKDLIQCNLSIDEGMKYAEDNKLFQTVCEKCIKDAIAILDDLI